LATSTKAHTFSNVFGSFGLGPSYRGGARGPQHQQPAEFRHSDTEISTVWVLGHALTEPSKSHLGRISARALATEIYGSVEGHPPRKEEKTAREPGLPSAPSPPAILGSMRNRQIAENVPDPPIPPTKQDGPIGGSPPST